MISRDSFTENLQSAVNSVGRRAHGSGSDELRELATEACKAYDLGSDNAVIQAVTRLMCVYHAGVVPITLTEMVLIEKAWHAFDNAQHVAEFEPKKAKKTS